MAPNNEYLSDTAVQERLVQHHSRLVVMTTKQYLGEDPETHFDFDRKTESDLLAEHLNRFAEPDFVDGKVTVQAASEHVYGADPDEYLLGRVKGMLQPSSTFNKHHSVNGLVYVVGLDGTILRGDRHRLAEDVLLDRIDKASTRVLGAAARQNRGIEAALRKAGRIDPDARGELEQLRQTRVDEIGQQARLALGSGE